MRIKHSLAVAAFVAVFMGSVYWSLAQQQPAKPVGGFVPGQVRPPLDPAQVAHGKAIFAVSCQGCHGKDLRGGDMGGPNLLRSQVALSDQDGEKIIPIIQGARQAQGMPNIGLSMEDSQAVAAYVRSVIATIGRQGTPPSEEKPLSIVVGNVAAGKTYFGAHCQKCHSPMGDLQGIASRIPDAKALQNLWVSGQMRGQSDDKAVAAAAIALPSGERLEGQLVHVDDFIVSIRLSDGTVRTFPRDNAALKVDVHDPLQAHRDLLPVYTDTDIHNVTAYLVTLK